MNPLLASLLALAVQGKTYKFHAHQVTGQHASLQNVVCHPSFLSHMHRARGISSYTSESHEYAREAADRSRLRLRAEYRYKADLSFAHLKPEVVESWTLDGDSLLCQSLNQYANAYLEYRFVTCNHVDIHVEIASTLLPGHFKHAIESRIIHVFRKSAEEHSMRLRKVE